MPFRVMGKHVRVYYRRLELLHTAQCISEARYHEMPPVKYVDWRYAIARYTINNISYKFTMVFLWDAISKHAISSSKLRDSYMYSSRNFYFGDSSITCTDHFYCYFARGKGAKYCGEYICLSVCLSAHITRKPRSRTSPNFYACCLWPWLGPPLMALRYVMYFRFYGWRHVFIPWDQ